ncbi:ABC transporter permease [Enterococcus sp. CWB-B31]|uniref:ABC transporter permease n=1 Tax=Enterococcus sp. CWB-B31 TaxID=2885159 RepID=UPI001E5F4C90|nr:ABC transporter permease [Enterococcus sp. CWB-B31]MCB5954413.1 ABC transporter permease [Enterococcus sp. CWB-B31]
MNFVKRALYSVARRKGKSILLFAVIFILGNVIAGAIAIQQSTQNVEKNIKKELGGLASIEIDYENNQDAFMSEDFKMEFLSEDLIKQVGESPYVKYYDYNITSWIETKTLKAATMEDFSNDESYITSQGFNIKGSNLPGILDAEEKIINVTEGKTFTQEDITKGNNVVVISSKVAEKNGLSVGDQMIIDQIGTQYTEEGTMNEVFKIDIPVEIIGIFEPTTVELEENKGNDGSTATASDSENQYLSMEKMNTMYMPNKTVLEMNKTYTEKYIEKVPEEAEFLTTNEDEYYYTPVYVMNNADEVEAFKEETQPLLPELYTVRASTDQYDQIAGSMGSLSKISGYVVTIAVAAALLIISLVVLLFMRDRKHELGIYLSLGDKRGHVMGQIIIEMVIISGIALILSLLTGNFLGKVVSDALLNSDMLSTADTMMDGMVYYGGDSLGTTNLTNTDVMNSYKVEFSLGYIVTYLVVGMTTTLLSAVIPLLYILRLDPKKIMM